jgi:hypothetical protein
MSLSFSGTDHTRPHPRFAECFASVDLDDEDPRALNWSHGTAAALWPLLGLPLEAGAVPPVGEVSIPEARRAIIRARARFGRLAPQLAREAVVEYGPPREGDDGTIELRPLRYFAAGLDEAGIARRLDAFERFVGAMAERGATHLTWS